MLPSYQDIIKDTSAEIAKLRAEIPDTLRGFSAMAQGASKQRLQAKAFGGGNVIAAITTAIGATNIAFTLAWLEREGIPLQAHDFGGPWSRKVLFEPNTGTAWCRRHLGSASISSEAARDEARYAKVLERPPAISGKRIELF